MITAADKKEYYTALLDKNKEYEGVFYVGVTSTGVFCRPTCPARKPKFEHCEFFHTPQEALLASFRPCKRCKPLSHPNSVSDIVQKLVALVEDNPEKRWKDRDFQELLIDESTARRQFKKRFGMTFVAYARARRMGLAMKQIRSGQPIIEAQLSAGYESNSGFRDAFSRIMRAAQTSSGYNHILNASQLDTCLGPMIAIANPKALYLLEFVDRRGLERDIEQLSKKLNAAIIPGRTPIIDLIEDELNAYFSGKLQQFKTPFAFVGSPFQQLVWQELQKIPYGKTCFICATCSSNWKTVSISRRSASKWCKSTFNYYSLPSRY